MAPTTRAAAKGHTFQTKNGKKGNNQKAGTPQKEARVDATRCRLLELPPELRNRIYHLARELEFVSPLLVRGAKPKYSSTHGSRRVFALTQVCKQIREEFRPLWLRNSAVRIELENLNRFINTYYPKIEDYQNAPRLLVISWDHGDRYDVYDEDSKEDVLFDITLLFRLRAHCPTFTAEFDSRRISEEDFPDTTCWECEHSLKCDCDIDCYHEDAFDEAFIELISEYTYMNILNDFLANGNETWLNTIREDLQKGTKIEFTFELETQILTIYIRFAKGRAPAVFQEKNMYNSGVQFLTQTGILELELREQLDLVVGEATGKYTRHFEGCSFPTPTYNQVHISGSVGKQSGVASQATLTT